MLQTSWSLFGGRDSRLFSYSQLGTFPLFFSLLLKRLLSPCQRSTSNFRLSRWSFSPSMLQAAEEVRSIPLTLTLTNVVQHPIPGFIFKTKLRTKGASSLRCINIPSLGHALGRDWAKDRHHCPVRCLTVYLVRTKISRERKRLFLIFYQKEQVIRRLQNYHLQLE